MGDPSSNMINKRDMPLKIAVSIIALIAMIHVTSHIIIFETNLSLINQTGLSGYVIGNSDLNNLETTIKQNEKISLPSLIIIIIEWIFVFSLIALSTIRKRLTETIQKATHIELEKKKSKSDTDIDILYEMLKKNKKMPLSRLAELFKVDKKVVEEWGKILEENGYAIVDYPRFGEIEIILKDEQTQKE
jgi:hypothetical protein